LSRRSPKKPAPPPPRRPPDPAAPPTLHELERFSTADLDRWATASARLDELQRELHFGLESQRHAHREALLTALSGAAAPPLILDRWVRLVEYQYSLEPLSPIGSVLRDGGRFNIGREVGDGAFRSFPALYVASDLEVGLREYYQIDKFHRRSGLTREEFALRREGSFTAVEVGGRLNVVFDIGRIDALKPFVDIVSRFKMPPRVVQLARKLKLPPPRLIRSPSELRRVLTTKNWRAWPAQFDLPATSQVFGGLLRDAGFEAVLYPSARGEGRCVALFPENFGASQSYVEVMSPVPIGARMTRIDSTWDGRAE
jgi:hypothetical protein